MDDNILDILLVTIIASNMRARTRFCVWEEGSAGDDDFDQNYASHRQRIVEKGVKGTLK